ncbi:tetratricopeptide repeat protein [Pontibacter lucknowensis]|uniref:Tetratricopeptide repeat-containing protein n=1 Tax=Pontibacter lucknowensis TaxID=1077936 RepID=A0A1N6Y625_9BACT|nr:tetratricopeptide repeat protein [Pontibacter lucknowensis]SIR10013.1 Tetratricopeptide repeat-containing protein [Pontibacter lucknowensis]
MSRLLVACLCYTFFLVAIPAAFAQHPDQVAEVKARLERERQELRQEKAKSLADRADRMLDLGMWQEAEALLQKAAASSDVKLTKARLAMLQHKYHAAEALVGEVLKQAPANREALLLQSKLQIQAWELPAAMATAQRLLRNDPKDEEATLITGRILMLQKRYNEALAQAVKVQRWNPNNSAAYLLESDVLFWDQKPEEAEKPLVRSLTLNPFDADARFNYGYAIWRRVDATQLNAMAAQWELALELNPLHYVTHWHWGNGHTNLTYADYAQPEDEAVRKALQSADLLISQSKLQEALTEIRKVQQAYPASVLPDMLRGSAYYMAFDLPDQPRLDSAEVIFQRILRRKQHYGPAHNALAAVIKQKQLVYLAAYDSLTQIIQQTKIADPVNFARVFPDVTYYPGETVQKMVWSQLYASTVYFPFLSRQGEKFVIPPLHIDLAIAMNSPYFRQATTFDNRQWMDIRGVGSGAAAIEYVIRGAYLERNVVLHEYVHLFHGRVFTDAENRAVRRLYHNAMKEGRSLDYYSANNEHEYLAQTYPAYFEPVKVHPLNHKSINTTGDLKAKDPELYTFLDKLVKRQEAYLAGDKQAMASNWAQVYLNLAERETRAHNFPKAAALLDSALIWDANYQPALLAYAGLKQRQLAFDEAQQWLDRARQVNKDYAPIYTAEADLLEARRRAGQLTVRRAVQEQQLRYDQALLLEDDLLTRARINQAFREMYTSYGRLPEAIAVGERYVQNAPTISTYLRDRRDEAQAYTSWLRGTAAPSQEAERTLAALVARKPQHYELRQQYAEVLATQGKYTEAIATLAEAQRILAAAGTPRPGYMVRMAAWQLQLGDKAAAQQLLEPVSSGKVRARSEATLLARVYAGLGDAHKAQEELKKQPVQHTPAELADFLFASGKVWEAEKEPKRAQKAYEAALRENPYLYEARQSLVRLLHQEGKSGQAERLLAAGIELGYKL